MRDAVTLAGRNVQWPFNCRFRRCEIRQNDKWLRQAASGSLPLSLSMWLQCPLKTAVDGERKVELPTEGPILMI